MLRRAASLRHCVELTGGELAGLGGLVEAAGADPAYLGYVDHFAVGAGVFGFYVLVAGAGVAGVEGLVYRGHFLGAGGGEAGFDFLEAFDLEADVVDAFPVFAALAGYGVALEVEDRHVYVAVAEHEAFGVVAVELGYLAEPEHLGVEFGGLFGVVGGDGDVLDLRHFASSPAANWSRIKIPRFAAGRHSRLGVGRGGNFYFRAVVEWGGFRRAAGGKQSMGRIPPRCGRELIGED